MATLLRDLLDGALDLIFAPVCVACSGPIPTSSTERGVCLACWARARSIPPPRCERCWTPLADLGTGDIVPCVFCPELRPAIRCIRSAFLHEGPVKEIVHAIKYRGWHCLAAPMARRMASLDFPSELRDEVDVVVPVPIARARRRQRGYNQAELLGSEIARLHGWSSEPDILVRERSTGTQTALHRSERRANVFRAFQVQADRAKPVQSGHVLLVDDVWTTGATALACADALLEAGARAVSVLTFARALPDLERHARRIEMVVLT